MPINRYSLIEIALKHGTNAGCFCSKPFVPCLNGLSISARAYHRVLKLAGSPLGAIADLAGAKMILPPLWTETLQYRPGEVV